MNNSSMRKFILSPNGFFFSFLDSSYFCGRYRSVNHRLPTPIEVTLHFPFLFSPFVSFFEGELRVDHDPVRYRLYKGHLPLTIYELGGYADEIVGEFQSLDSLMIHGDNLIANGEIVNHVHSFPARRFELNPTDLSRANMFIGMGFKKVRFVYSWYRKIFFVSLGVDWFTLYLRVAYRDVDNE